MVAFVYALQLLPNSGISLSSVWRKWRFVTVTSPVVGHRFRLGTHKFIHPKYVEVPDLLVEVSRQVIKFMQVESLNGFCFLHGKWVWI
jgi:hypothetical protein